MNTTLNGSSCGPGLFNPTATKIGFTFAYCLLLIVSLVGNSLIAIIVYKTQTMRKPINFFIVNMAMSDLLFPIIFFPSNLTELYVDSWLISGPLGLALCKLVPFLGDVSTLVSIQSLVLIAVDRFGAVVFPLRSPLISSKLCRFFILATWIVAMAVHSPYLVALKLLEFPEQTLCLWQWNDTFGASSSIVNYFLAIIVVFNYFPMALLTILYSIILIKLKTKKIPGQQSANSEEQRNKRHRNVLRMAIAIVLGFVLCWMPITIMILLVRLAWDSTWPCGIRSYELIFQLMAGANCAINPCICFIFSGNYRQGLKRLVKCFGAIQE